jgi:hypothetical protein
MIRSRVQDAKPDEEKPTGDYDCNLPFIHPEIPRANPDGGITCRAFWLRLLLDHNQTWQITPRPPLPKAGLVHSELCGYIPD